MGKKIGIFGGTFDPVHIGHVALVVSLFEAHSLDSVFIIPANRSPHKQHAVPEEAKHRLNMLKIAFCDLPYCQVLALELERPGPSYTIDTIAELKALGQVTPEDTLYLLLGQDQLAGFGSWKNVQELMQQTTPLVARRNDLQPFTAGPMLQKWVEPGLTPTAYFEVSATEIRNRIKKKRYCGHLLNNRVYEYIQNNNLYE
jgi:nicotinate-nucleotide adenylyltransferase